MRRKRRHGLHSTRYLGMITAPAWSGKGNYAAKVLGLAPIAYWPLNETSGAAAVNLVDAALNGSYTGVDLAQSQAPFICPLWGGSGDVCNIYSAGLNTAFSGAAGTIMIWGKVAGAGDWTDGTKRTLMIISVDGNNRVEISKSTANNTLQFEYRAGGTSEAPSQASYSPTGWAMYAITWSKADDQVKAYINGTQIGSTATTLGTWAGVLSSSLCSVGATNTTPTAVWNGYLAHVAVWTSVLTQPTLASLYAWGLG